MVGQLSGRVGDLERGDHGLHVAAEGGQVGGLGVPRDPQHLGHERHLLVVALGLVGGKGPEEA
ncbi:MAG TPA: hypothetical protein VG455_06450 [Acidimicrobiales bacterium]|nr:hypothetical protein [Acidimicrobiales bacterium]